ARRQAARRRGPSARGARWGSAGTPHARARCPTPARCRARAHCGPAWVRRNDPPVPGRGPRAPARSATMRIPRPRFLLGSTLCLTAFARTPAAAAPDIRLSEILAGPARDWDGSGTFSSRDDEWIEIVNGGTVPADLTPYFVTDGDSLPRFGLSGTLAPGAVLLVTGAMSVAWERATAHPVFGLSLGNTGDRVMLWKVTGADTTLVDEYAYKAHEAAADRATGRTPDGSEWKLEDQLDPYAGTTPPTGTGCPPTPGAPNTWGVVAGRRTSWGAVKAMYR